MTGDRLKPRRRPVQGRSSATVEAIIQAAWQLVAEAELAEVTTHGIAARAGVSIGTLYQYFPSKEAIFNEMVDRQQIEFYARVSQRAASLSHESLGCLIEGVVDEMVGQLRMHTRSRDFIRSFEGMIDPDRLRQRRQLGTQLMKGFLEARRPDVSVEHAEVTAWLLMVVAQQGLRLASEEQAEAVANGVLSRELTLLACRYLGVEPPPAKQRDENPT